MILLTPHSVPTLVLSSFMLSAQRQRPSFTSQNCEAWIVETFPIGSEVTTVTATDEDDDEICYSIVGDEDIIEYFYINPQSGSISVSRPVRGQRVQG